MTKQVFKASGQEFAVETSSAQDGGFTVSVNGEMFGVTLDQSGADEGVLYSGNQALPYFVCRTGEKVHVWLAGKSYLLDAVSNQPKRGTGGAAGAVGNEVKAPMPGTVLKINVKAGDTAEANAPLIIMESMKMEMTLAVPAKVQVKEVLCKEAQLVEVGAILLKIEPVEAS